MCEEEKEDLEHFLLRCPAYSAEKSGPQRLQQRYKKEIIGDLIFKIKKKKEKKIEETKRMSWSLWKKEREKKRLIITSGW